MVRKQETIPRTRRQYLSRRQCTCSARISDLHQIRTMIRSTCSPRIALISGSTAHRFTENTRRGILNHYRNTMSSPSSNGAATRVFPPLYVSSGNASADRLAFFHILERLKVRVWLSCVMKTLTMRLQTQKRTGWVDHQVCILRSLDANHRHHSH